MHEKKKRDAKKERTCSRYGTTEAWARENKINKETNAADDCAI
jgi:hypothetical protein